MNENDATVCSAVVFHRLGRAALKKCTVSKRKNTCARRRAVLTTAGSYVVSVTIGGKMVSGWPTMLHILPGPANAVSSWLTGDAIKVGRSLNPEP